jgi:3-hydroxyisobutyrate dehydrogenase-like beta-hydroxyacid dehydrogenase
MQLGMIGLGRMGANMARRLRRGGIDVVGYNRDPAVARRSRARAACARRNRCRHCSRCCRHRESSG